MIQKLVALISSIFHKKSEEYEEIQANAGRVIHNTHQGSGTMNVVISFGTPWQGPMPGEEMEEETNAVQDHYPY